MLLKESHEEFLGEYQETSTTELQKKPCRISRKNYERISSRYHQTGRNPWRCYKRKLDKICRKKILKKLQKDEPKKEPFEELQKKLLKKPREEFLRELQQESLEKLFERILRPGGISGEILAGIQKIFIHTCKNIFVKGLFSENPFRNSS